MTTVVDALWERRRKGRWHPDWPTLPDDFLSTLHDAASAAT